MKNVPLARFIALAAVAGGLGSAIPSVCRAYPLESQLDCRSSAHRFIAPLRDEQYIDATPMRVEANSVNAFKPTHGSDLTAYGFRVYAVLGYEHGDAMFKQGAGQPINDSAYGVVVLGSKDTVEARVREAGSTAVVHEVLPMLMTAVFCDGSTLRNTAGTVQADASSSH
ncbi:MULTISPECIES: hypothetical protein [unclassified Caballeronia]|uniref:hypothetical protein n=1 Tax=unclassified Caballeronia TaxID=2646786 RepID=UPI002854E43F|nr:MULTISPECIES: hypothetical protein [unclassified Caballeronia]MDR5740885.1 hypothetical protein [Caballeronia sp. LZ016]MDR5808594.1 hypothetical protein [Caballeronia sp. LZ019]